jgi:hypothetical protein
VISDFRRDVDEICSLLGYYAALTGNSVVHFGTTNWSHLKGSRSQTSPFPIVLMKRKEGEGVDNSGS